MSSEEKKKRVLIVDDEEDMIWSLQKNLPNETLQVDIITASSGEEALLIIGKTKVDLIVTDIRMPGISGIDLLIAVRNSHPDIDVIVMTAFPSSESKEEVVEKGGLRFIEKPFDIQDMRDYIRNALQIDSHHQQEMMGIQLIDIVQVNILSQSSVALRVNGDGQSGLLYFSDGNIVHATYGDLVGEEAFYKIMSIQGWAVDSYYPDKFPETTIHEPAGALLLKGAILLDEMNEKIDYLEELNPDQKLSAENGQDVKQFAEESAPAALSDPEPETDPIPETDYPAALQNEKVEEEEMEELNDLLNEFTNIPGVNTSCLVGRDGFLLHSVAMAGVDAEMIGAIASSGFGASEAMGSQLQKGSMSMTMVEYENGPVMFAPVGTEAFLVIIADREANLGMIRLKIKRYSHDIEQKAGI